jgi:hypothetical protein
MNIFIYILIDPRDNQIRYVGKTKNAHHRFYSHTAPSMFKDKSHKSKWIKKMVEEGFLPILEVIETTDEYNWESREKYWIKYYKDLGYDLTNGTDGGASFKFIEKQIRTEDQKNNIRNGQLNKKTDYEILIDEIKPYGEIFISKKELEIIETIKDFKYQKILFIIILLCKINLKKEFKDYINKRLFTEIVKLSKVKISKKEFEFVLGLFVQKNLINILCFSESNNFIQPLFLDVCDDEPIIIDCANIEISIQKYVDYLGGEIIYCADCGKKILRAGRNHSLCRDCWWKKRNLMQKERMYEMRHRLDEK